MFPANSRIHFFENMKIFYCMTKNPIFDKFSCLTNFILFFLQKMRSTVKTYTACLLSSEKKWPFQQFQQHRQALLVIWHCQALWFKIVASGSIPGNPTPWNLFLNLFFFVHAIIIITITYRWVLFDVRTRQTNKCYCMYVECVCVFWRLELVGTGSNVDQQIWVDIPFNKGE